MQIFLLFLKKNTKKQVPKPKLQNLLIKKPSKKVEYEIE